MRARNESTLFRKRRTDRYCDMCHGLGWVLDGHPELTDPIELEVIQCPLPDCRFSKREVCLVSVNAMELSDETRHPRWGFVMSLSKKPKPPPPDLSDTSNILSLRYDHGHRSMVMMLRDGECWSYQDVPEHVYEAMLGSPSKGSFFNRIIRGHYKGQKIERPDPTKGTKHGIA